MVLLQLKDNAKYDSLDFPKEVTVVKGKPTKVNMTESRLKRFLIKNPELMVIIPTDKKVSKRAKVDTEKKVKEEVKKKETVDVSGLDDKSKARVKDLKNDLKDDGKRNYSYKK